MTIAYGIREEHNVATQKQLGGELAIRAATLNDESRTVEATLASEDPKPVFDARRKQVIDETLLVDGFRAKDSVPLFIDHSEVDVTKGSFRYSTEDLIGSSTNIRMEGDIIAGTLHFAAGDDKAERTFNKIRGGHLRGVSPGYRIFDYVEIAPGQTQNIRGRSFTAGSRTLRVVTDWEIREVSVLPFQADERAQVRSYLDVDKEVDMKPELRQYLETIGLRHEATEADAWSYYHGLTGDQQIRAEGINAGTIQPSTATVQANANQNVTQPTQAVRSTVQTVQTAPTVDETRIRREAAEAERQRIEYCRSAQVEGVNDDLVVRAINEGWDDARVDREYLTAIRSARSPAVNAPPAMHVRSHERDCNADTLMGGFMTRCGIDPAPLIRGEQDRQQWEQNMNNGERYAGYSMMEMVRECVRIHGARTPEGMSPANDHDYIRAALSTPTLSYAFTNSMQAVLVGSFLEETPVLDFCEIVDVPNFKENDVIGRGKGSGMKRLPRGKTAKHATFSDNKETYRVHRFAEQLVLDEQDIIDDNLDIFQTSAPEMGMDAARVLPDIIYYLLMSNPEMSDGKAVFHADHANTDTNALNAANLKTGITKMGKQKQDNVNLDLKAQYLITTPTLEWTAKELVQSAQIVIAGTSDPVTERGTKNVLVDAGLQIRGSARLENGVTDPVTEATASGSATKWFLASRAFRTIRAAYRSGTGRRPQIRRFVLDKGQWGIGWDIAHDVGAGIIGYQGLYRGNN